MHKFKGLSRFLILAFALVMGMSLSHKLMADDTMPNEEEVFIPPTSNTNIAPTQPTIIDESDDSIRVNDVDDYED